MTNESLSNRDWTRIVERLGGSRALEFSARETKAFLRPREVACATDLLRLILSYCLSAMSLRSTAAWAGAIKLAKISDAGLIYRLRQSATWLEGLVAKVLQGVGPPSTQGRLIRILDGTSVAKAGTKAKKGNQVWRVHGAFDLPLERFGHFVLTDEKGAESLDRAPVVKGEIRLADRGYMHPDAIGNVIEAGGDIVVRAGWKSATWLDAEDGRVDLIAALREAAPHGSLDRPIIVKRKNGQRLALRLIAVKKSPEAAEKARRQARRAAQQEGYTVSQATLEAADWMILVTSLEAAAYPTKDILDLYRLRWRIEIAFKRLKSLIGLAGPPGFREASAKPWVLAHLLIILLLEPFVDELEDSPHWAQAA
jgi:Transposase DDE domain